MVCASPPVYHEGAVESVFPQMEEVTVRFGSIVATARGLGFDVRDRRGVSVALMLMASPQDSTAMSEAEIDFRDPPHPAGCVVLADVRVGNHVYYLIRDSVPAVNEVARPADSARVL